MTVVRLALANLPYPDSRDDAVARAVQAIADAAAAGAMLVCFPECYVPGYRTADRPLPPPDAAWLAAAWTTIAAACARHRVAAVVGTERAVDGRPMPSALVVQPDGTIEGFQDKVQIPPEEEGTYVGGCERRVFTAGPLTFGVVICHEGWRYPETVRWAARRGAQVVFHPHYSWDEGGHRPVAFGDPANSFHEKAALCRAAENSIWFATVNYAGDGAPTTSAFARPDGTVHAWMPYGEAGLLVADIDLALATGLLARRYRAVEL